MVIKDENIRERFRKRATDDRISCSQCLDLAVELGIPKNEIAAILTEMDIKIVQCQLGCFS